MTEHIKYSDGTEVWYLNNKLHREDGPAIIWPDGRKEWWVNGEEMKQWWLNGEQLTKEGFERKMKQGYKPIETAPAPGTKKMFVVIAKDVDVNDKGMKYTSDPYCVWRGRDGEFIRWPHPFSPTHWYPLP